MIFYAELYIFHDCKDIDLFLYSASMPESFFIFIHYDNLYLLTDNPYSNIYLYFGVGFFLLKVWYCWLQASLSILLLLSWALFLPWSSPSMFLGCWSDGGNREGNVSLNLFMLFSYKIPVSHKDKCKTSPKLKWGLQISKGSGIWENNMINVKEYYRRQSNSHISWDFLFWGSRAYHWLCLWYCLCFFAGSKCHFSFY